jgi:hypothetical protein
LILNIDVRRRWNVGNASEAAAWKMDNPKASKVLPYWLKTPPAPSRHRRTRLIHVDGQLALVDPRIQSRGAEEPGEIDIHAFVEHNVEILNPDLLQWRRRRIEENLRIADNRSVVVVLVRAERNGGST